MDRLGSNHTRQVGDSMGADFLARIHGREDEDRPRHLLSHWNRFSLFSNGESFSFSIVFEHSLSRSDGSIRATGPVPCPSAVAEDRGVAVGGREER